MLILFSENLPNSHTTKELDWVDNVTLAASLEQHWGVFAPLPATLEATTFALVTLDDGRQVRWDPPAGSALLGSTRAERWRKWSTRIRLGEKSDLWEDNAWRIGVDVGREHDAKPVLVELVRRWSEAPLPGEGFDREYSEFMFYSYDAVTGEGVQTPTGASPSAERPAAGGGTSEGEFPNPGDQPPPPAAIPDRDVDQTSTQQLDPVDTPPNQLPYVEADADVTPEGEE